MSQPESFLRRWSRLKLQARPEPAPVASPAPILPQVDMLDFSADFSPFMHPEVDADTRRNALRKLFMTDHYRAMDGLDVYVEDYSCPELLPSEMLETLNHAQALLMKPEQPEAGVLPEKPEEA